MVYLINVTLSWCFKVHFRFFLFKCKSWNISEVFCPGFHVTVTFSWCFKVHFEFLSLKCKSWVISVVFSHGLPCHCYILLLFQSSFWIFYSLKCKSWNISVVFCYGLPCHCYILMLFQSSFWIIFVEMQELKYFSSVFPWFTMSMLHSLDVSKFMLDLFRWNARVGIFR